MILGKRTTDVDFTNLRKNITRALTKRTHLTGRFDYRLMNNQEKSYITEINGIQKLISRKYCVLY